MTSEVFVAAGGSGALATIATFAKVHWDAIKDRKAFKTAKKREAQPSGTQDEATNDYSDADRDHI